MTSEAQERIWFWWDDEFDVGFVNTNGDKGDTPDNAQEYVRADLVEELEAKIAKVIPLLKRIKSHQVFSINELENLIEELKGDKP